jgi:hypothetical protein
MGWGDEIMVTAEVRRLQARDPRKVAIRGRLGEPRWNEIWEGNPRIATPLEVRRGLDVQWHSNCGGSRPYIDYSRSKWRELWAWNPDYRVEPGEIYLSEGERAWAAELGIEGSIVISPMVKPGAPLNKHWGDHRWRELLRLLAGRAPLVQLGPTPGGVPPGVRWIETETTRKAAAAVSRAALVVTAEGGLHHCAAALGVRAVVIFGGFISPATTGYDGHINLFTAERACGRRAVCGHCGAAMAKIPPSKVARLALEQLELARGMARAVA